MAVFRGSRASRVPSPPPPALSRSPATRSSSAVPNRSIIEASITKATLARWPASSHRTACTHRKGRAEAVPAETIRTTTAPSSRTSVEASANRSNCPSSDRLMSFFTSSIVGGSVAAAGGSAVIEHWATRAPRSTSRRTSVPGASSTARHRASWTRSNRPSGSRYHSRSGRPSPWRRCWATVVTCGGSELSSAVAESAGVAASAKPSRDAGANRARGWTSGPS